MKKILFATFLLLGLYGCGSKMIETENFCAEKNIENDSVNFSVNICLELPTKGSKSVIDSINSTLIKAILDTDFDGTPANALNKHIAAVFDDYQIALSELPKGALSVQNCENINGIVTFLNKKYLCYRYDWYSFLGGAHGLSSTFYFVFDLKTGKILTEEEIFKSGFQDIFSGVLTEILSNSDIYPDNAAYELDELKLNGNFSFEPDTLIYTFNEYEIAPYSSGKIDVKIPYEKIKEILNVDLGNLVE